MKISGTAGKLSKLGIKQQSKLIESDQVPLRHEHTSGDLGLITVKKSKGELVFSGVVFEGNEQFVKTFKHVSAAILLGDEVSDVLEISLTKAPRIENTTIQMEE